MIFCIRRNLTASGPRPNPQGSYYYGSIPLNRTIVLENYPAIINGKQRYIVNSASFIPGDTPFKLADYFQIPGLFTIGSISDYPTKASGFLQTSVMGTIYQVFVEIVFKNPENVIQSWHMDGHNFFVVG